MSYVIIPEATDDPAVSQSQLKTNFTALNTIFGEDHVELVASADNGEHTKVTFNDVLAAAPNLGTPKASLFPMADSDGTTQLFFENFDTLTTANILRQMTNLPSVAYANGGTAGGSGNYIDTPWGFRVFWLLTNSFSGNRTIVLPAGSGTIVTYQFTPNTANGSATGGVTTGALTITAGNPNAQELRALIITKL